MNMDRVVTWTLAYCILHNFCEIYEEHVLLPENVAQRADPFVEVRKGAMRLFGDGRTGKVVGEHMRATIFESWVARNPNV